MERVDFTNAVEDARYKINNWVTNETHGECNAQFFHRIGQLYVNVENCQHYN